MEAAGEASSTCAPRLGDTAPGVGGVGVVAKDYLLTMSLNVQRSSTGKKKLP
jgi:hypothetical protein